MQRFSLYLKLFSILAISTGIFACATRTNPAPIVNATVLPSYLQPTSVVPIAANQPSLPSSHPKLGTLTSDNEVVAKPSPTVQATRAPLARDTTITAMPSNTPTNGTWIMPTEGKIISYFTPQTKGIDISGKEGQAIYAINNGKVVYSGNGLKGYGNLIIIKHDKTYLSAYAHNKVNLVTEGAMVKRGQKIAEMGLSEGDMPVLHLEIRKNGKPVNPLTMLSKNTQ